MPSRQQEYQFRKKEKGQCGCCGKPKLPTGDLCVRCAFRKAFGRLHMSSYRERNPRAFERLVEVAAQRYFFVVGKEGFKTDAGQAFDRIIAYAKFAHLTEHGKKKVLRVLQSFDDRALRDRMTAWEAAHPEEMANVPRGK